MGYDPDIIAQIAARSNIVEIIGERVPLKKSGTNYKGLCPFHPEKTPSFMVSPAKQIFHCFGCHVGGDVFSFITQFEKIDFGEAIRSLAERAGVVLPERSFATRQHASVTKDVKALYTEASAFYQERLRTDSAAEDARRYLKRRNFSADIIARFQLGFSPRSGYELVNYFRKKNVADALLVSSGVCVKQQSGELRDLFRGRIIFPIWDSRGDVIAFGGRVLDDSLPKYLNTPETDIFKKREELYGLHRAKHVCDTWGALLIVEGYCDVIRLHEKGFEHAVATLGTSLTQQHARIIRRYTNSLTFLFDNDAAGIAAAMRGIEVMIAEGLFVNVVVTPGSKDPDEFLNGNPPEVFAQLLKTQVKDFFDFKMDMLRRRYDVTKISDLSTITSEMLETLRHIENHIIKDKYLQRLSRVLNINEYSLRAELGKKERGQRPRMASDAAAGAAATPAHRDVSEETAIVAVIAQHSVLMEDIVSSGISDADFSDARVQEIMRLFLSQYAAAREIQVLDAVHRLENEQAKALLSDILIKDEVIEDERKFLADRLREVQLKKKRAAIQAVQTKIDMYLAAGSFAQVDDTMSVYWKELSALRKEISDLKAQR